MPKTLEDLAEEGKILEQYGKKNFLTISPAIGIDRLKMSIVEIGKDGKDPAEIYIMTSEAAAFFEDVLSGVAGRRFNADVEKAEPESYIFRTADTLDGKGQKVLKVGGGKYGVRFQTEFEGCRSGNGKRIIAVPMHYLRMAAHIYLAYIGIAPAERYIRQLVLLLDAKEEETQKAVRERRGKAQLKKNGQKEIGHLKIEA